MKPLPNHTRSSAFTLIEMMVVVIVLGILAATIIPQFRGATYDAKLGTHHPTSFDLWSRGADRLDGGEGEGADIGNW